MKKNKKNNIIIWGTGKNATEFCRSIVDANIIAFVESKVTKNEYYEKKVITPDKLIDLDFDYLVITPLFSEEIWKDFLEKSEIIISKIVCLYVNDLDNQFFWVNQFKNLIGIVENSYIEYLVRSQGLFNLLYLPEYISRHYSQNEQYQASINNLVDDYAHFHCNRFNLRVENVGTFTHKNKIITRYRYNTYEFNIEEERFNNKSYFWLDNVLEKYDAMYSLIDKNCMESHCDNAVIIGCNTFFAVFDLINYFENVYIVEQNEDLFIFYKSIFKEYDNVFILNCINDLKDKKIDLALLDSDENDNLICKIQDVFKVKSYIVSTYYESNMCQNVKNYLLDNSYEICETDGYVYYPSIFDLFECNGFRKAALYATRKEWKDD